VLVSYNDRDEFDNVEKRSAGILPNGTNFLLRFAPPQRSKSKLPRSSKNTRRNSAPSVSLGGKAFPPKCTEKIFGRMICRQNHFKSFCQKIILPENFQNFILSLVL